MAEPLSAFSQSNRLRKFPLARGSGIDDETLLFYELSSTEDISTGFSYPLVCLSSTTYIEPKDLTDDGAMLERHVNSRLNRFGAATR